MALPLNNHSQHGTVVLVATVSVLFLDVPRVPAVGVVAAPQESPLVVSGLLRNDRMIAFRAPLLRHVVEPGVQAILQVLLPGLNAENLLAAADFDGVAIGRTTHPESDPNGVFSRRTALACRIDAGVDAERQHQTVLIDPLGVHDFDGAVFGSELLGIDTLEALGSQESVDLIQCDVVISLLGHGSGPRAMVNLNYTHCSRGGADVKLL